MDFHTREQGFDQQGSASSLEAPSPQSLAEELQKAPHGGSVSSEIQERYRLEAEFLAEKLGSLGQIRRDLGLSQRKISELFLVDPASWNRWEKKGRAPGYIYKSVQWFLALRERHPEIASLAWLKTQAGEKRSHFFEQELARLKEEVRELKSVTKEAAPAPSHLGRSRRGWVLLFALGVGVGWALAQGL